MVREADNRVLQSSVLVQMNITNFVWIIGFCVLIVWCCVAIIFYKSILMVVTSSGKIIMSPCRYCRNLMIQVIGLRKLIV